MLYALAILLCLLWGIGLIISFTMGGLVHVLLVAAVVLVLVQWIRGRQGTAWRTPPVIRHRRAASQDADGEPAALPIGAAPAERTDEAAPAVTTASPK